MTEAPCQMCHSEGVAKPTWGPTRISLVKLRNANQMMGAMSTPPTGGISFRVGPSTGSVGSTATDHGSLLLFTCRYR